MEVEINAGSVELRKVIGMRCTGMKKGVDKVLMLPRSVRGSSVDGVSINRVLAASTGESIRAASAVAAVEMRTVAAGALEARIDVSGSAEEVNGSRTSGSAIPNSAARKLRKNVSSVRERTLWMKVVLVPRHMEKAPLLDESAERASTREYEFFRCSLSGDEGGAADCR